MNDSVLRGFCKKCGEVLYFDEEQDNEHPIKKMYHNGALTNCTEPTPDWFLSAQQIRIIENSKEFHEYWLKSSGNIFESSLPEFLDNNPFLVAKILSEAKR